MKNTSTAMVILGVFLVSITPSISRAEIADFAGRQAVGAAELVTSSEHSVISLEVAKDMIAQGAGSQVANLMCASYTYAEGYRYCYDVTFGIPTPGMCIGTATCLGLGTVAITGAAIGIGKGIVEGIIKGQPGANVTGGVPAYGGYTGYSPYISGGTAAPSPSSYFSQDISNLLAGIFGSPGVSATLLAPQVTAPAPPASGFAPQPPVIPPSTSKTKSDVFVNYTGATIQAGVSDAERNIEFVAFFGANVPRNTNPEIIVARQCIVRPWQNPLISYVIPYPIFDKLCLARKLAVGVPVPPPPPPPPKSAKGGSASGGKVAPVTPVATSTVPVIAAKADIWAVPPSVSLGGRTSIFWNATGVAGCDLRSSDGIFSGDTISGNAASAPVSTTTVFAISCLTADNVRVSNFVTVKVGI